MNWSLYASFLAAAVLILMVPGPSLAYTIALATRASRREVLLNAAGMGLGGLVIVLALALALGFAHLLRTAPLVYTFVQVAGCIYLVVLGVQAFRAVPAGEARATQAVPARVSQAAGPLLQGFLVETTNPKIGALIFS